MKKILCVLLASILLLTSFAACQKEEEGSLGESGDLSVDSVLLPDPTHINPGTAYPTLEGLHTISLAYDLEGATKLFQDSYPNCKYTSIALEQDAEGYLWKITGTNGTALYHQEINAQTGEISWDSEVSLTEEELADAQKRTFTTKDVKDPSTIMAAAVAMHPGNIKDLALINQNDQLVYQLTIETPDKNILLFFHATTGDILE